jgi:hypothetical protein
MYTFAAEHRSLVEPVVTYKIKKLVYWGVESKVHSALRPPISLLCQPRMIMMMEKLVE